MKKLSAHVCAAALGFLPIALFPFDDPILLGAIAIIRAIGGLFGGYLIFCFGWFVLGVVAFVIYERLFGKLTSWLQEQMNRLGGAHVEAGEATAWRDKIRRLRYIAHQLGADATFIYVLCGPFLSVPFLYHWGYRGGRAVVRLFWAAFLAGTIWYLWYAGVVWSLTVYVLNIARR